VDYGDRGSADRRFLRGDFRDASVHRAARGTRPSVPGFFLGFRIVHRELRGHAFLRNSDGVETSLLAFRGGQATRR